MVNQVISDQPLSRFQRCDTGIHLGRKPRADIIIGLFLFLTSCYSFFWQDRDWNSASRLMLTYAIVDRGTIYLDGLEIHAGNPSRKIGDLAVYNGHYLTEKAPGQSLLGVPVYSIWKWVTGSEDHPVNLDKAKPYWVRDYWITIFTSGIMTAVLGGLIYSASVQIGIRHFDATLLALCYGLGTYASVYATLFYGHQSAACLLFGAYYLILFRKTSHAPSGLFAKGRYHLIAAGMLAGFSVVIEMTLAPIVLCYLAVIIWKDKSKNSCVVFSLAVATSVLILPVYHWKAFGDPFSMGYHHIINSQVRMVHQGVGLWGPDWSILPRLLWGAQRGLFIYAPISAIAVFGWLLCLLRLQWWAVIVPAFALVSLLLVNVSHFYWAGGLSTGPRLLLPALPLLFLPLAYVQADFEKNRRRSARTFRLVLVLFLFVGLTIAMNCAITGGRFGPVNHHVSGKVSEEIHPLKDEVYSRLVVGKLTENLVSAWFDVVPLTQWLAFFGYMILMLSAMGWYTWRCR